MINYWDIETMQHKSLTGQHFFLKIKAWAITFIYDWLKKPHQDYSYWFKTQRYYIVGTDSLLQDTCRDILNVMVVKKLIKVWRTYLHITVAL